MSNWTCKPCKVTIPYNQNNKIRAHLATKKHERLKNACPVCSSLKMTHIEGETWDRDGIREARKCERCLTEFKSFAQGLSEKHYSEYTGKLPQRLIDQEAADFHRIATARGYVKK